jgi:hypothetical protein
VVFTSLVSDLLDANNLQAYNDTVELLLTKQDAGRYKVRFSAQDYLLANGVYFYKLRAGSYTATRKFVVMKLNHLNKTGSNTIRSFCLWVNEVPS